MSIIPTAKVCQSILEMDEIHLVSKINMIPVHILKIIIGNLSTEKFKPNFDMFDYLSII